MKTEKAYLAGGCFWCLEASFKLMPGVTRVTSGYAGGDVPNPTYKHVSAGTTGHAETVEIEFDPKRVSFEELLKLFFKIHDPSQKDRQGADIGSQYRSAIFYTTESQRKKSQEFIDELKFSGGYENIYTTLSPLENFWPAEEYHQNYFEKHPHEAYCQTVVQPKIEKTKEYLKNG